MRILQIVHGLPPEHRGGVETYVRGLARALARTGDEVTIFCPRRRASGGPPAGTIEEALDEGVRVRFVTRDREARRASDAAVLDAARRTLREVAPEIVALQYLAHLPPALAGEVLAGPAPVAVHLHDFWWVCPKATLFHRSRAICDGPGGWKCLACKHGRAGALLRAPAALGLGRRKAALLAILERADLLVASSADVRDRHAAFGVPPDRCLVAPYAAELPPVAARPGGRAVAGRTTFGYLGRVVPEKGVHVLVRAFREVRSPAALEIHGDGPRPYLDELRALAAGAAQPIELRGPYARDDLFGKVLPRLDAVCLPSIWPETYGLVLDEAIHAGVPVVLSDLGGMRERFRDGKNAIVVPPGDAAALAAALERLASDYERVRASLSFDPPSPSIDLHAARVRAAYADAVGRRSRA